MSFRSLRNVMIGGVLACSAAGISEARAASCFGPMVGVDMVLPRDTEVHYECLLGDEWAAIEISGDGDTDLDLYVYTPGGTLVDRDIDLSDQCYVLFKVPYTGVYRVEVRNLGFVSNIYEIEID